MGDHLAFISQVRIQRGARLEHAVVGGIGETDSHRILAVRSPFSKVRWNPDPAFRIQADDTLLVLATDAGLQEISGRSRSSVTSLPRSSPLAVEIPVTIWLADGRGHTEVVAAVEQLLAEVGLEFVDAQEPQTGSWFRRLTAALRNTTADRVSKEEILAAIERKIELEVLDRPQAEVDLQQATGAAALITALQGEDTACVQLGSVLLLKINGAIVARNLTSGEMLHLKRNATLFKNPNQMLESLEQIEAGNDVSDRLGDRTIED